MYLRKGSGPHLVSLPDGTRMSQADLPPEGTARWVAARKAAVVRGVEAGLISRAEAINRYDLSEEEYDSWAQAIATHGTDGLKTTRIQRFR